MIRSAATGAARRGAADSIAVTIRSPRTGGVPRRDLPAVDHLDLAGVDVDLDFAPSGPAPDDEPDPNPGQPPGGHDIAPAPRAAADAAQLLPALPGAIIGIPLGIYLYHGATGEQLTVPPLWQLLAVLLGALLVITGLTAIPARAGARRPPAEILAAETA